jgi:hypothetical protein
MEPSLCDRRNDHSIAILILLPVLFAMLKERALRNRTLRQSA